MVGLPRAKELLYSGREVFADEAYHMGLINHLVPSEQLLDKTVEIAAGIAKNRVEGVANIKQMLQERPLRPVQGLVGRRGIQGLPGPQGAQAYSFLTASLLPSFFAPSQCAGGVD